jgi:hypothetical protein
MVVKLGFFARKTVAGICWGLLLALPGVVFGQTGNFTTNGTEYPIVGSMLGDQVLPDVALTTNDGGFVVWQDNITDGDGWGVSAMNLSGSGSSFRVNVQGAGDQENPRVALLPGGGAAFVWQGGPSGYQHVCARFLSVRGTWRTTNDVSVNTFTNNFQVNPAIATLTGGNVIVVWGSFDEVGPSSLQDVYGRTFSMSGTPISGEFLINEFTNYNQRTPTVAALADGGFVAAWVSEQERVVGAPNANAVPPSQQSYPSVDIYARLYNANGSPRSDEFLVNADSNPCAHPSVAAGTDGGFMISWDAHDMTSPTANSLDIYARSYTSAGAGSGSTVVRVNTYLYGDQYAPRVSSLGTNYLVAWTSMAQDGSREGVYGQFLQGNGSKIGGEFQVNTTTISSQMQPAAASDGVNRFLVVWTSYTGNPYGFDLFAQRYQNIGAALQPMAAPFVNAPFVVSNNVYQPQLTVSWSPMAGLSISDYEVYVNGATTNMAVVTTNNWTMTAANGLAAGSSNWFQVDYVTTDGSRSPLSPAAGGATWSGLNYYGIPFEWMEKYYGYNFASWPANVNVPLAPGGLSLLQVFLSGGNPNVPSTWLQTTLTQTSQGMLLSWNTQPGFTYQVQVQTSLGGAWTNLAAPRFAAGSSDEINVGGTPTGYYRVLLLRQ